MTSYLFPNAKFSMEHLNAVLHVLDQDRSKLVIDLSCRRQGAKWIVAMNKWQTLTDMELDGSKWFLSQKSSHVYLQYLAASIKLLEPFCSEFLIHAADNEGLQRGIDEDLVQKLGQWCTLPVTYAGGGKNLDDLTMVKNLSSGRVDLTIGSALDIFGGQGVKFDDCVEWNKQQSSG